MACPLPQGGHNETQTMEVERSTYDRCRYIRNDTRPTLVGPVYVHREASYTENVLNSSRSGVQRSTSTVDVVVTERHLISTTSRNEDLPRRCVTSSKFKDSTQSFGVTEPVGFEPCQCKQKFQHSCRCCTRMRNIWRTTSNTMCALSSGPPMQSAKSALVESLVTRSH